MPIRRYVTMRSDSRAWSRRHWLDEPLPSRLRLLELGKEAALTSTQRRYLEYVLVDGLSIQQIAVREQRSTRSVNKVMEHARAQMKRRRQMAPSD